MDANVSDVCPANRPWLVGKEDRWMKYGIIQLALPAVKAIEAWCFHGMEIKMDQYHVFVTINAVLFLLHGEISFNM